MNGLECISHASGAEADEQLSHPSPPTKNAATSLILGASVLFQVQSFYGFYPLLTMQRFISRPFPKFDFGD